MLPKQLSILYFLFGSLALLPNIQAQTIAINEIHCNARKVAIKEEFIELHNYGKETVDLSQWSIKGGVQFTFPDGTALGAGQYLLVGENPQVLLDSFGKQVLVLGAYQGNLDAGGDLIQLSDKQDKLIDEVEYGRGFPWPLTGGASGYSLQLMHPELDNNNAGHWRSARLTPGLRNEAVYAADKNAPPLITRVRHSPQQPHSNESVLITARVRDTEGVSQVQTLLQIVAPGKYIRLADANYEKLAFWQPFTMNDSGENGDKEAGDGIYSVTIPDSLQKHRYLMRYRVWARDETGKKTHAPHPDDTQPNFAYFVYDSIPDYAGIPLAQLNPLPTCHLIANAADVDYLIFKYGGTNYKQTGTVVYNGEIYDHVGFRSRGYNNRHTRRKRNLKINFNRGHDIEVIADYGKPYKTRREKLVLSGTWLLDKPNTHGLAESVLYRFFTMQGAPASYADYMHFRVIDNVEEKDTFSGDFWGIYLVLENQDRDFLRTHSLPDGNIYSFKPFKHRHEGEDGPYGARNPAFVDWDTSHNQRRSLDWWRANLDVEAFCGFVIANQAINNRETGYRGQHWWAEYHNPKTKHWYIFPWDLDLTWKSTTGYGTVGGAIRKAAFWHSDIQIQYENQLRSFLDLLYNEEQAFQLIDEEAGHIYNPNLPHSWADADKMRWKQSYADFADEVNALKQFVIKRRAYILESILPPAPLASPTAAYTGQESYPVDELTFVAKNIIQGTAVQWRVAEVYDKSNPYYRPNKSKPYEINTLWQSGEMSLTMPISLPFGSVQTGRTYRVRVRVRDAQGRYSHWSAPHQFIPNSPIKIYGQGLVIHEVMYNPSKTCDVEFIEIKNTGTQTVVLDNFFVKGGIDFVFPKGTEIAAGEYLVLANSSKRFKAAYGLEPMGEFKGSLSNKGESLKLFDPFGGIIDSVRFDNKSPWDEKADGEGFSLELIDDASDNSLPENWAASNCQCGTPNNPNRAESIPKGIPFKANTPGNRGGVLWGVVAAATALVLGVGLFSLVKKKKS